MGKKPVHSFIWVLLRWLILEDLILKHFIKWIYRCDYFKVKNTRCFVFIYNTPIANIKKMFKVKPCQMWFQITKITWSTRHDSAEMLKMWSNQWSEDDNWKISRSYPTAQSFYISTTWIYQMKFSRGYPTDIYLPLGLTPFFGSPGKSIKFSSFFCLTIENLWEGLIIPPSSYFSELIYEKKLVFFFKISLSSQNCGIFHDFNVGLFRRLPVQCGTP